MTTSDTPKRSGPPLPKAAYKIVNPIMKVVLRSPLHRLLSESLMVLSFTGRKSGKRYDIPVGYLQPDDTLFVFSHSTWANNFRAGAPVQMRLRGKQIHGMARVIEDRKRIAEVVGKFVARHGQAMAQRMGLIVDGQVALPGTTFVEITLEGTAR